MSQGSAGDFNHIQDAIAALHDALAKAVAKAAQDVRNEAKTQAPVATGYLRDSIYASTHEGSDYGHGNADGALSLPEVPKPTSDLNATTAVGAYYGEYVEMGTRKMAAEPFLLPAVESVRKHLPDAVAGQISIEMHTRLGK